MDERGYHRHILGGGGGGTLVSEWELNPGPQRWKARQVWQRQPNLECPLIQFRNCVIKTCPKSLCTYIRIILLDKKFSLIETFTGRCHGTFEASRLGKRLCNLWWMVLEGPATNPWTTVVAVFAVSFSAQKKN